MINLIVGQQYPLPTPSKEGASANFLIKNGNTLQINIPDLSREELFALKNGKIKAGFLYENGDLIWLFTFYDKKGVVFTLDGPFDVRIIPNDLLALHDITNSQQRLVIDIHVIDNNILRVLRAVTMPPKLTVEFLSASQDQLTNLHKGKNLQIWMMQSADNLVFQAKMYELGK